MTLYEAFESIEKHPLTSLKNSFLKVKKNKQAYNDCVQFIQLISHLHVDERQLRINRMFMDKVEKPKLWKNMVELIQIAHSIQIRDLK